MLTVVLAVTAVIATIVIVWFAAARTKAVQRVSNRLSGPVEQMQEQIMLTADTAVDRLDDKIAQMEILLSEIDRRSALLAQHSKQQQMQQLEIEQQQQKLAAWFQTQRQQMEKEFQIRQQMLAANQEQAVAPVRPLTVHAAIPGEKGQPEVPALRSDISSPDLPRPKEIKAPRQSAPSLITPSQDKRAMILEMAEQGFSVTDIAQKMSIGKGEVMLLLKLRKKTVP